MSTEILTEKDILPRTSQTSSETTVFASARAEKKTVLRIGRYNFMVCIVLQLTANKECME